MGIAINRGINQASDRKGAGLRGERKALPTVWEEVPEQGRFNENFNDNHVSLRFTVYSWFKR